MSLYELPPTEAGPSPEAGVSAPETDALRAAISRVMAVQAEEEISRGDQLGLVSKGQLLLPASEAAAQLEERLTPLGYSAFLQREDSTDVIMVVQGVADADRIEPGGGPLRRAMRASGRSPLWLHIALLLATIASTVYAASILLDGTTLGLAEALAAGGPFALTLLFILGVHEMGHYVAARRHRVKVTLPFFIPLPIPGSLGTLGAVIFIRSALKTRRSLFDVGISGPLAGLVVALPLFVIGLLLPPIEFGAPISLAFRGVGVPFLLEAIGSPLVEGSLSRAILLHPVALAAWFGVLLTALNLLPLGQFDGGHVAYALFGRRAWPLAYLMFAVLAFAGIFYWPTWLIWAVLASLTGLRHPPPHDDITPLDLRRKLLGWLTILIFLLIIVPRPIISRQTPGVAPNAPPIPTVIVPDFPTPTPFDPGAYK